MWIECKGNNCNKLTDWSLTSTESGKKRKTDMGRKTGHHNLCNNQCLG